jgi:hypothetical protein|tara:strand:+ start:267 stop:623 length:357 start_codon:yes stop_codon:yes gene_type:complete
MAINYTWSIPQMQAHIEFEGESNVIYQVQYIYLGTEESGGETYSSSFMGSQTYTYEPGETFVPYENTEAFENVVIGWLEGSLDLAEMQAVISERVQEQIAPVNEDLYFTWQNPVTPVE